MVFYFLVLQVYVKNGPEKDHNIFLRKKAKEKQNIATIMIFVDGKRIVFQWRWNYTVNRLNKDINKENFGSCEKHGDSTSVSAARVMWTYKDDVNSAAGENLKRSSSSTISTEASCNGNSIEETLNLNKTC